MKKSIKILIEKCPDHPKGCYIRFTNRKIKNSEERKDVIIDYDEDGKIVGIEFWHGLK